MKYKLCLFDFDYTLADTTKPIVESFRHTFKTKNLEGFDREKAIKTIGLTLDDAFQKLTGINDKERVEELVEIYRLKSDEITIQNTILYEDTIETELLPSIETKFGDIKSKILDNLKLNNEIISFNNEEVITVQKFCLLCMIRSKSFVSEVENKSLFIDFYDNSPQNVVLYQYFKSPELLDKYIVANNLSYVKNETNINYILPRFYVVGIKQKNGVIDFFIPISPKILIRLTTEKTINKQIFYIEKMTDFDVDNFNKLAIFYELKHNNQAVYAKNKNDLERYVDYLKELKK